MTISPCRSSFFVDYKELHQLLLTVQEKCRTKHSKQIVSISLPIDFIDPLVVLEHFSQANTLHFYFENKSKGEAIIAIDAIAKLEIAGQDRFNQAESFIKDCLKNVINFGKNRLPFSGTHFFCGFSFFDQHHQADYPFPSATVFLPNLQVSVKNQACTLVINTIINSDVNTQTILQDIKNKIKGKK